MWETVDCNFEYRLGLRPLLFRAFRFCTTLVPAQSAWPLSLGCASPQQTSVPSEFCQLSPLHGSVTRYYALVSTLNTPLPIRSLFPPSPPHRRSFTRPPFSSMLHSPRTPHRVVSPDAHSKTHAFFASTYDYPAPPPRLHKSPSVHSIDSDGMYTLVLSDESAFNVAEYQCLRRHRLTLTSLL